MDREPGRRLVGPAPGGRTRLAPVEPGEEITLRWSVYDSGDGILDSTDFMTMVRDERWKLVHFVCK